MRPRRLVEVVAGVLLSALAAVAPAQWKSTGLLKVPPNFYTFLATTPSGDLLAATFNRGPAEAQIPALLIKNPTSETPELVELCRVLFPQTRGFGGIACDSEGNFFVSGDTGDRETSFVRKFRSDGKPDPTFGEGGGVFPKRRCLGVEALGKYLFVCVDWAEILVMDTATGAQLGSIPKQAQGDYYLRDIAIDPKALRLFGVGQGGIVTWGGGTPWAPAGYTFRELKPKSTPPVVGEGIAMDPFRRCVIITPSAGGEVQEVFGNGSIVRSPIEGIAPKSSLTDSAISFDGSTLFVSDYIPQQIHVLRREVPNAAAAGGAYAALPVDPKAPPVPAPQWERSYTDVLERSRAAKKPMLVYFRHAEITASRDFEKRIVLTPEFNRNAEGFTCVFEDTAKNRLLAFRFGVTNVPHLVLFTAAGDVASEFKHPIDPAQLFRAMADLKK